MTTGKDNSQHLTDVEDLLSVVPVLHDQEFSQRVLRKTHQYRQRRLFFLGVVWLIALASVTLTVVGIGPGDTLIAIAQQAGGVMSQLDFSLLLDLAPLLNAEDALLSLLQNTAMLVLTAAMILLVVFASTGILD